MDILLVDGYNVIGAWKEMQELRTNDFAAARSQLIDRMAEYQAYTGWKVVIIFDAHLVPGKETILKQSRVEVIYTKENETADERIERVIKKLKNVKTQIHVATSDETEQWTVFSQGALRKSSRELLIELKNIEKQISLEVKHSRQKKTKSKIPLKKEIEELFEKWRRGL
ncbi:NYN domain-containing protein [Terrilactibacillus laevilacticus]|uniref:NYN domain-containing protein n=1 Tax=Terrilactibacillus laevilacticus TaxID=1380157 RepID=A0ABW5PR54_9BACI|nr:NYN domain-containing protein [Terrilactibacillus laevilacticus]